jgi:putative transposase
MLVLEYKVKAKPSQFIAIDEAIRTAGFCRNKALRYWMDTKGVNGYDLNKYMAVLAKEFDFADKLNSMARQSSAERAWFGIKRFFDNCKKQVSGKKGYPKFKKQHRSVEYKTCGWKLIDSKTINFTDGFNIGKVKLIGTHDLNNYDAKLIKRVRIVRRGDGYYCQFCIDVERKESPCTNSNTIGIDVGLEYFYTDSNSNVVENPRLLRKSERKLKKLQRRLSKKMKGSNRRIKARKRLAKKHLQVSRQRKDFVVKTARALVQTNSLVVYEDLQVRNMVKNHNLAKSISDASWSMFTNWIDYYVKVFSSHAVAVAPHYTSQQCSSCGVIVKKSLSTRTHSCKCGCELHRDHNAAINILAKGLNTLGHSEINAQGQNNLCVVDVSLKRKLAGRSENPPL